MEMEAVERRNKGHCARVVHSMRLCFLHIDAEFLLFDLG